MHRNNHQEFLGIDVGDKRIGIARGSTAARIAEPLKTVSAETAIDEIAGLAEHYHSAGIVIGLPRSLEGAETAQTKKVRDWAQNAKSRLNYPFYWQDEALTSHKAESLKLKAKTTDVDAEAAAIILQDFLDTPKEHKVRC